MKFLFNITHGFQARMLLRSPIADELLARGAQLVIVSTSSGEQYFRDEFTHPQITLEDMPHHFSRVESHLITLRQYLLMNPSLGATLNFKSEVQRRERPIRYWLARAANSVLGRVPLLRKGYLSAENALFPGREFDALLERHKPDLVVTGTPGLNGNDMHLLRSARRLGYPSATVMLSWDNLTSKGYMGVQPNDLIVWSDLMASEAVQYHGFPADRIYWCGAAQFDHYHALRERFDRHAWRAAHGIPPDAPLIVYGTINPALLPHEAGIVRMIVEQMRAGKFHRPPYLWIRIHPQAVRGYYKAAMEPYDALRGPDVHIELPPVQSDKLAWDLPRKDNEHLSQLMAAADIVVTPNSTLSIDAACAGTPIINIFFDGPELPFPAMTSKRFLYYTHYSQILETGGIAKAMSIEDFTAMANAYIDNPALHSEGREAIIRQQLNCLDGRAGERTAEKLWELAASQSHHDTRPHHSAAAAH